MKKMLKRWPVLGLALTIMLTLGVPPVIGAASLITKEELKPMLDDPDLVIIDTRRGRDWKSSEFKIKGAVRADAKDIKKLAETYGKNKKYVSLMLKH